MIFVENCIPLYQKTIEEFKKAMTKLDIKINVIFINQRYRFICNYMFI